MLVDISVLTFQFEIKVKNSNILTIQSTFIIEMIILGNKNRGLIIQFFNFRKIYNLISSIK